MIILVATMVIMMVASGVGCHELKAFQELLKIGFDLISRSIFIILMHL